MNWADKLGISPSAQDSSSASIDPSTVPSSSSALPPSVEISTPETQDASFETSQVEQLAREQLDFLAALAMPLVFKYCFPAVFKSIWTWLLSFIHKSRDFSQLAIGLPRGFAKTTFTKIFLLYVILFSKRQFILVCAANVKKAVAIISDVCDFLDEPNIKKVFGDWRLGLETDQQELKKFSFRGRTIILAAGTVSTVRGLNVKHQRPDVMLFDDIQTRDDADSEVVSKQIETDLYGTAMKAKSPHGCLFIFIGNMYPTKWSLLRRIKTNPNWMKFIAGGILADGTSLWEELQPIQQLLQEYQNDLSAGRPEVFFAEVLNDENASVNNFIDTAKIPPNPFQRETLHNGNYIIIDPATDKTNADAVSIGYFEVYDEKDVCTELLEDRLSPGAICEEAIKMALRHNCRLIVVESNAFQYVLGWLIQQALTRYGIVGIEVVPIYSGHASKNSRILTMFKQLLAGEILLADQTRAQVISQIIPFNPLKTTNTDGILDLLCYAPRVRQEFGEFLLTGLTLEMQELSSMEVHSEAVTSPF